MQEKFLTEEEYRNDTIQKDIRMCGKMEQLLTNLHIQGRINYEQMKEGVAAIAIAREVLFIDLDKFILK